MAIFVQAGVFQADFIEGESAVLQQIKPKGVGRLIFSERLTITYWASLRVDLDLTISSVFRTVVISSSVSHGGEIISIVGFQTTTAVVIGATMSSFISCLVSLALRGMVEMSVGFRPALQGMEVCTAICSQLLVGEYRRAIMNEYDKILV